MTDRETGYYWVRDSEVWKIAEWCELPTIHSWKPTTYKCWRVIADEMDYKDSDFLEIDENEIKRQMVIK